MTPREQVLRALEEMGICCELCEHAPVQSIADCAIAEEKLHALVPRNVFLCTSNQKHLALLLCRPRAVFRTGSISKQAGLSRLSFAPPQMLKTYLGAYPGCVSPLGLIFDRERAVKLLMDETLLTEESLLFHPLDSGCSVKIRTNDLINVFLRHLGYDICRVRMENIE